MRSSAAFAVDPQGFVIGSSGNVPEDGFEGTGAELSYVMSQADVMKPEMGELRSIALEFANRRLSGFRSRSADGEGFVIAFIDAEGFTIRPAIRSPDSSSIRSRFCCRSAAGAASGTAAAKATTPIVDCVVRLGCINASEGGPRRTHVGLCERSGP